MVGAQHLLIAFETWEMSNSLHPSSTWSACSSGAQTLAVHVNDIFTDVQSKKQWQGVHCMATSCQKSSWHLHMAHQSWTWHHFLQSRLSGWPTMSMLYYQGHCQGPMLTSEVEKIPLLAGRFKMTTHIFKVLLYYNATDGIHCALKSWQATTH